MSNPVPRDRDIGDDEKFLCLLSRYLDRLTTPEEEAALADELRRSEPRRQCFVEYCRHVAMLQELVSKRSPADILCSLPDASSLSDLFAIEADAARKDPQRSDQPTGGATYGFLSGAAHGFGTLFTDAYRLGSVLVIAAMMFALGSLAAPLGHRDGESRPEMARVQPQVDCQPRDADIETADENSDAPSIAARFVRGVDAVWEKSSGALDVGAPLEADRVLSLRQGTAEIAFDSGARVFLQGPARFELASPMAGILRYGSLSTEVPKEAKGFVVQTPRASIVDYGTSFSLKVDPNDKTEEAYVHEGEIRVGVGDSDEAGKQTVKRLLKGEGVRIDADASGNSVIHGISHPSVKRSRLKTDPSGTTLPSEIGGLRLWLRADAGTCRDLNGDQPAAVGDRVARWLDQSGNELNPRQRIPDYCPRLVETEGGRLALRFDGRRQRLEEPAQSGPRNCVLESTDSSPYPFTICAVFATSGAPGSPRQSLFAQFPRGSSHLSRQIALDASGFLFYSEYPPTGVNLASPEGSIIPRQVHVAMLLRDGQTQSLFLDGRLAVSDDQAERYAGNPPRCWWIGGRRRRNQPNNEFFQGDLFELIVFTRAIPEDARTGIEGYLEAKYRRPAP